MRRKRVVSSLLLVAGLVFALLGQFYFTYKQEFWRDGVFFWCVSVLAFVLLWRRVRAKRRRRGPETIRTGRRWLSRVAEHPLRVLAALGGMALVLVAGWTARTMPTTANFSSPLLVWLTGVGSFLAAFVPGFSLEAAWRGLLRRLCRRRIELLELAALLLAAFLVRVIDLEHIPTNLGGDEGTQGLAALQLVGLPLGNPFLTGWYSVPTMSFLAYGVVMRVFGATVAGLRLLSALVGTATVLGTFLLARELWGRRVAWLAAMALACAHYHVHFSRLGSNQIADGLFVTLALWLLVRGMRRAPQAQRPFYFALSGAVIGLGWYGYFGARLVGVIVTLYLAWLFVVEAQSWRSAAFVAHYGHLVLILLLSAFVVVAPLVLHYAAHPDAMVSRADQVSVLSAGWMEREKAYTGRSAASILLQQLWKAISAFHYTRDPTFWYHPSIPFLDFVSGVLFLFGLVWTVARWREPGNTLLLLWFWLAVILGWALTENPPSSQRLIIVTPALALLVGLGLNWLAELAQRVAGEWRLGWRWVAAVSLAFVAASNLYYYFGVYTPSGVYGNPTAEVATRLGRYLAQQEDDYVVYFYGPPVMYWEIGNLSFLVPDVLGMDMYPPGEVEASAPLAAQDARFVFLPHRVEELAAIKGRFPDGVEQPVYSEVDGRLLYVLYEVGD